MTLHGYSSAQKQERASQPTISRTRRGEGNGNAASKNVFAKIGELTSNQQPLRVETPFPIKRNEGLALLVDIEAVLRRFIWLPNERDYTILALWIVYTYAYDLFDHAPRIALHSPVPGCGKSTLFRILRALVRLGDIWTNPTEATLFRDMAATHPTILFDEMDKYLYSNRPLLAVLNSGHMAGVTVPRTVGEGEDAHVVRFDVFGPVAFALKGVQLPADLADRSFRIDMQKSRVQLEKLTRQDLSSLTNLGDRIKAFVQGNWKRIEACAKGVKLPEAIINRAGDNWVPLFAIAETVGGEWPERVARAALDYEHHHSSTDKGIILLSNIKTIMESSPKAFFPSQELCSALIKREDWPWGEYAYGRGLTTHRLAKMLKPFGIFPRQEKMAGTIKARGYHKGDFEKAWQTYNIQSEPD
jgi:hypothetical protein